MPVTPFTMAGLSAALGMAVSVPGPWPRPAAPARDWTRMLSAVTLGVLLQWAITGAIGVAFLVSTGAFPLPTPGTHPHISSLRAAAVSLRWFQIAAILVGGMLAGYIARERGILAGLLAGIIPAMVSCLFLSLGWFELRHTPGLPLPAPPAAVWLALGATVLGEGIALGTLGGWAGRWLYLRRRPAGPPHQGELPNPS